MILHDIKQRFRIPNAYSDWKAYREFLTNIITKTAEKNNSDTIAIIGAGCCNDVDIKCLCNRFKRITLLDYNREAVEYAVRCLNCDEAQRVEIKTLSITGLDENDLSIFFENVLSGTRKMGYKLTAEGLNGIILPELDRLKEKIFADKKWLSDKLENHDIIVCNGVCSQLFSMMSFFIRSVVWSIPEQLLPNAGQVAELFEQELKGMNDSIIPIICEALIDSANDFAIFGNEFSDEKPVEGAHQCVRTLRAQNRIVKEYTALWNFNSSERIEYNMLIQVCKRNKM